jgi:PAS domain S-box-containing protein
MSDAAERRLESAVKSFVGAEASNDAASGTSAHARRIVQLHPSTHFLSETVGRFFAKGIVDGECVLVMATAAHRRMLCEHLRDAGFDVPRLQQSGRLALFDAREVLDSFMSNGQPDAHLFHSVLGALLAAPLGGEPGVRIRAYGEMVDLLWKEGNRSAALRVEQLWRQLGESFELDARRSTHAEEHLRLFVECLDDCAISMLDPRGCVVSWNVGAQRIEGYSEQEIVGTHFSVSYPKDEVEGGTCEHALEVAAREGRFEGEGWRIRKDGSTFWANVVITAVCDREGRLVGYGKVTRDLTAQRARERESLQRARDEEGERRKEDFLAILGHELRNPLAPMTTAMHLIKERHCAACEREIAVLDRQLTHLTNLLDDLTDVARTLRGNLVMSPKVVDLRNVLADAVEQASPHLAEHAHRLEVVMPDTAIIVRVDPDRIVQVFVNLLSNAGKYTRDGGHILLRADRHGDGVRVIVEDDGIGITREFLDRLFDLFSQAKQGDERQLVGLGVGLAMAKRLVAEHGGRIEAASDGLGRGSRFTVWLPLSASVPPVAAPDSGVLRRARRILVVDDNVDHASMLRILLGELGHQVATAHDGLQGMKLAQEFRPDLVFLDLGLPELNGFEVCRRLRQVPEFEQIPIVAVTGYARASDRKKALEAGFTDHVAKPFDIARIVESVYGSTAP